MSTLFKGQKNSVFSTFTRILFTAVIVFSVVSLFTNQKNSSELISKAGFTMEVNMLPVGDDIEAGKALFMSKACFACHGMNAEGNALGPNMTDNFTKQGCSEEEIIDVINKGVAGTAMVPYEAQLKPEEVKALAKYIISLQGSNPANAKAPEGEECK